ncbi:uncharacterized protein LOC144708268 [Wolffia australiana]
MKTRALGFKKVKDDYAECPNFGKIVEALREGPTSAHLEYLMSSGYLFYRKRLCVPRISLRDFLIWETHAGGLSGHFGRNKTIQAVEYQFYWPSLKRDVANLVACCLTVPGPR